MTRIPLDIQTVTIILRPTIDSDFKILQSWVADRISCKLWAGPKIRFPFTVPSLKHDLQYADGNTFSLVDPDGLLLGLGQILFKNEDRIHLARIIVHPDRRNQGFGFILCQLLMVEAQKRYGETGFSLNVYAQNMSALRLYKKLGFASSRVPEDVETDTDCLYMEKRLMAKES